MLASTLAKLLQVPFAIADATTLTEAGYVGDDVENILLRLIQNADHQIHLAEKGIIFIDEIDKIGRKSENASITRDVSGEGVQQALLKIIEGAHVKVPLQGGRKHPQAQTVDINTGDILFICGGAFVGIEEFIALRMGKNKIGFKVVARPNQEEETSRTLPEKKTAIAVDVTSLDENRPNAANIPTPLRNTQGDIQQEPFGYPSSPLIPDNSNRKN